MTSFFGVLRSSCVMDPHEPMSEERERGMDRARRLRDIGFLRGRYQSKFIRRHEPKTRHTKPVARTCVWESLFMRKSTDEKREIIQRPWELPMAAQHLAVILIQKRVRGMLCREHLRLGIPSRPQRNQTKSIRQHFQSPIQRFISSGNGSYEDDLGFRHFAAARIQTWYRMEQCRWRYSIQRFPVYHIAALQIQYSWKAHCQQRQYKNHRMPPRTRAALSIQAVWKCYSNRRIFRYYRDLIAFRNTGDPTNMLRAINPAEASLMDASIGALVRFRLGGMSFPPTIYYKIFTRKAVCDLSAFSPKDYTVERLVGSRSHSNQSKRANKSKLVFIRVGNAYHRARQSAQDTSNWYKRIENNGWRPVTAKVLSEANNDPVALATSKKIVDSFHHSKIVPKKHAEKMRRVKKRQWMQKLYKQGLLHEVCPGGSSNHSELSGEKVFDVDFENDNWEDDAEEMFKWAASLDYDEYVSDWQDLGKTSTSDERACLVE